MKGTAIAVVFDKRMLKGVGNGIWWASVTMTTVGYGDKAPNSKLREPLNRELPKIMATEEWKNDLKRYLE